LRGAIRLDARFAEAHYVLGLSLRAARKPEEAVRSLERSVALDPALLSAREDLADLYGALRRPQARLTQLEALAALQPGGARERLLGLGYARAGQLERAVGRLAHAVQHYPADGETYIALGRLWLDRAAGGGRVELSKALDALQSGVNDDSSSEALTLLGRALLLSGEVARAEQTLQQASVRFPVDPAAFLFLAEAAQRRGRLNLAHRSLLAYAALVPPDRFSAQLLARVAEAHLRAEDHEAARRTIDAALDKDPTNALALQLQREVS